MGYYEEKSVRRKRNQDLKRLVLDTVSVAGLLSVALVAPNVIGAMNKLGLIPSRRQRDSIRQARVRLVRQGLLEYKKGFLTLTAKGMSTLDTLSRQEYVLPKPKRWDGRWRVLVFDVPERKRGVRDKIRSILVEIGFVRMQDSVWLYPYDCEDVIVLLKADLKIGKDLIYMIVDSIEADRMWREHFELPIDF